MAERKFAALAELRRQPEPTPAEKKAPAPEVSGKAPPAEPPEPVPEPAPAPPSVAASPLPPPAPETQKGRGRPPGKRSDPDWAPRTILMRSKIHRRVSIMLLECDDGPDLSELVDQLLTEWISKQS